MPDQLTTARDQIAEMCGLNRIDGEWHWHGFDVRPDDHIHPIPACLNFVSRVWPDVVRWNKHTYWKGGGRWGALTMSKEDDIGFEFVCVSVTHDELTDRMTLLHKVLVWLRDNDRPAFDTACEKIRKVSPMTRHPFIVVCSRTGHADIRTHKEGVDGSYYLDAFSGEWCRFGSLHSKRSFPFANAGHAQSILDTAPPVPIDAVWGPDEQNEKIRKECCK